MRQRKKKGPINRIQPYIKPPEYQKYKRTYLEDKTLMPYIILMYNSLDERELRTIKLEAPDPQFSGQGIRTNEDTNPLWYQNLCSTYLENRTGYKGYIKRMRKPKFPDTRIRRPHVENALKNFIKNGYSHSLYTEDYIEIARELKEQYEKANRLYEEDADRETISTECPLIRDLEMISRELSERASFKVAEGFDKILRESNEDTDSTLKDKIPF